MIVKVRLSGLLSKFADWQEIVEAEGANTIECLRNLAVQYPRLKKWVYDKRGELRPQVWFFVNGERIYASELANPLKDGDELRIILAVAGG